MRVLQPPGNRDQNENEIRGGGWGEIAGTTNLTGIAVRWCTSSRTVSCSSVQARFSHNAEEFLPVDAAIAVTICL